MRILRESANTRNAARLRLMRLESFVDHRLRTADVTHNPWQKLQHLIPIAVVFEHDFPEQTNGRHAVAEELVMKFLQREIIALLRLVVVAQFQDLQFTKGVI